MIGHSSSGSSTAASELTNDGFSRVFGTAAMAALSVALPTGSSLFMVQTLHALDGVRGLGERVLSAEPGGRRSDLLSPPTARSRGRPAQHRPVELRGPVRGGQAGLCTRRSCSAVVERHRIYNLNYTSQIDFDSRSHMYRTIYGILIYISEYRINRIKFVQRMTTDTTRTAAAAGGAAPAGLIRDCPLPVHKYT